MRCWKEHSKVTGLTINVIKPRAVTAGAKLPVVIVSPLHLSCFFQAHVYWKWFHGGGSIFSLSYVLRFHPTQQGGWETGATSLCVLSTSYQVLLHRDI